MDQAHKRGAPFGNRSTANRDLISVPDIMPSKKAAPPHTTRAQNAGFCKDKLKRSCAEYHHERARFSSTDYGSHRKSSYESAGWQNRSPPHCRRGVDGIRRCGLSGRSLLGSRLRPGQAPTRHASAGGHARVLSSRSLPTGLEPERFL